MTTFLDTSAILCALNSKEKYHEWSKKKIEDRKAQGPLVIVDIVYCELSYGMASKSDVDRAIEILFIERAPVDDDALFRASRAFKKYKEENKEPKTNVLPDYLIGAFAETASAPLITTNSKDFKNYFPLLEIMSPDFV